MHYPKFKDDWSMDMTLEEIKEYNRKMDELIEKLIQNKRDANDYFDKAEELRNF